MALARRGCRSRPGVAFAAHPVLATPAKNLRHAEDMQKNPEMAHDDPNARRVEAKERGELLWRFTKRKTFEYGCLIPGHREAGMIGTVVVK